MHKFLNYTGVYIGSYLYKVYWDHLTIRSLVPGIGRVTRSTISCCIYTEGSKSFNSSACCDTRDTFDKKFGMRLAFAKALKTSGHTFTKEERREFHEKIEKFIYEEKKN